MRYRAWRNQDGVTLPEVLVTLLLFSMVASILYAFMLMGVSMYKRVSAETTMRNQSDALLAGLIAELAGAVHAEQGADHRDILYVKMSPDSGKYVDVYRMTLEQKNGRYVVSAYREGETVPLKRFELNKKFVIHVNEHSNDELVMPLSSLTTFDGGVKIRLVISQDAPVPAQQTAITMETRIPLTRLE
jgi:prepilin-type N-terminal cleavage/methylation domain-containing protein